MPSQLDCLGCSGGFVAAVRNQSTLMLKEAKQVTLDGVFRNMSRPVPPIVLGCLDLAGTVEALWLMELNN